MWLATNSYMHQRVVLWMSLLFLPLSSSLVAAHYCDQPELDSVEKYYQEGMGALTVLGDAESVVESLSTPAGDEFFDQLEIALSNMHSRIEAFEILERSLFLTASTRSLDFEKVLGLMEKLYGEGPSEDIWHTHLRVQIAGFRDLHAVYEAGWPLPRSDSEHLAYIASPSSESLKQRLKTGRKSQIDFKLYTDGGPKLQKVLQGRLKQREFVELSIATAANSVVAGKTLILVGSNQNGRFFAVSPDFDEIVTIDVENFQLSVSEKTYPLAGLSLSSAKKQNRAKAKRHQAVFISHPDYRVDIDLSPAP